MRINVSEISEWRNASKTRNITAKPMCLLVIDKGLTSKLLLETLEGTQALKENSMVCIGVNNDVWQQDKSKLLAKYDVIDIDENGWMVCKPKPDNEVECCQVTTEILKGGRLFDIVGQWGRESPDGFLQFGEVGDYICRNKTDKNDIWIVKHFLFRSTYAISQAIKEEKKTA